MKKVVGKELQKNLLYREHISNLLYREHIAFFIFSKGFLVKYKKSQT